MISHTSSSSFLGVGCVAVVGLESPTTAELFSALATDGFELRRANNARGALDLLRGEWMDAVVVAGELPDLDAATFCRLLRHEPEIGRVPIVVLSESRSAAESVRVLRSGADDVIGLGTDLPIVLARLKAILRRCSWAEAERDVDFERQDRVIRIGVLMIRPARYAVYVDGKTVDLTASEFRVLMLLAGRPYHVFTREQVFQAVHRNVSDANDRSIDSHVYSLRKKLGTAGNYIETVRGVGYRIINGASAGDAEDRRASEQAADPNADDECPRTARRNA